MHEVRHNPEKILIGNNYHLVVIFNKLVIINDAEQETKEELK